jgi:serine/threonine protein kinase
MRFDFGRLHRWHQTAKCRADIFHQRSATSNESKASLGSDAAAFTAVGIFAQSRYNSQRSEAGQRCLCSYNNKVDIWALGCILYELAVGKRAFEAEWVTVEYAKSGELPDIPLDQNFDQEEKESFQKTVTQMLNFDASLRPSANDLVNEFSTRHEMTAQDALQNLEIYQGARGFAELMPRLSRPNRKNLLRDAITEQPLNFWLWHAHYTLYVRENALDEAIDVCRRAFEESENNPCPIFELMNLHAAKGEYMKAAEYGFKLSMHSVKKSEAVQISLSALPDSLFTSVVSNLASKQSSLAP